MLFTVHSGFVTLQSTKQLDISVINLNPLSNIANRPQSLEREIKIQKSLL
jgi:hypothetical protein